jgi:hypothetical protein
VHRKNIACLDLTPRGNLLLTVDEDGRAILTNFHRRVIIHHFTFKDSISALRFSHSGRNFAVGVGRRLQIWHTPAVPGYDNTGEIEFAPFMLHRDLAGHFDVVQNIEWSGDSRFLLTASKDLTARVWSLDPLDGFEPTTLAGHRQAVRAAYFSEDQESVRVSVVNAYFTHYTHFELDIYRQPRRCLISLGICGQGRGRVRQSRTAVEDYKEELFQPGSNANLCCLPRDFRSDGGWLFNWIVWSV